MRSFAWSRPDAAASLLRLSLAQTSPPPTSAVWQCRSTLTESWHMRSCPTVWAFPHPAFLSTWHACPSSSTAASFSATDMPTWMRRSLSWSAGSRMCCTTTPPGSTLMLRLSVRMPSSLRISPRKGVSVAAACRNSAPACVFRSPIRSICLTVPPSTSRPMSTWNSPQGEC